MISLIFAVDENWLIGKRDGLPWHIKEDFKHFRKTTEGKKVIVGLNTYKGIGALPNRKTFLVSNDENFFSPDVDNYIYDLERFYDTIKHDSEEWFVLGGKSIYEQSYNFADRLYISRIPGKYEGDVYLTPPNFDNFELVFTKKFHTFEMEIWDKKR